MSNFRKREDCPPSNELLLFQLGQAADEQTAIRTHLEICEFCLAEVEFYSHYPPREEFIPAEPIPAPLYDLASAVLRRGKMGLALLDSLLDSSKNN